MHENLPFPDCDLRAHPPRSPRVQIAGLVFVARTADKVRAKLQNTLGFYKVGPGISQYLFEWLGISEEQFTEAVRAGGDDAALAAWLTAHCDTTTFASINERLSQREIRNAQHLAEVTPRYPILRERPELRNWFEILELDDRWMFDPKNAKKLAEMGS